MPEYESSLPVPLHQIALIGAGMIVVGAFLPWTVVGARVGISSVDGIITLVTGAVVGGYILYREFSQRVVLVGGGICSVIGVLDTVFPLPVRVMGVEMMSGFTSPAVGVYLTLFGGLTLLGVGIAQSKQ
jgi:hypothetical protein